MSEDFPISDNVSAKLESGHTFIVPEGLDFINTILVFFLILVFVVQFAYLLVP